MLFFDFLRKNKKALAAAGGLILVCACIALLVRAAGKDAAEQSHESHGETTGSEDLSNDPEDSAEKPSSAPQTEQASGQGTEPVSEPVAEPQAESTEEPEPTKEPEPVLTAEYELIDEGINVFNSGGYDAYFKYRDVYADLYMRRLQDDTGEYIELSLWSDQNEMWHTVNHDLVEEVYFPFWWKNSEHLALDQRLCYYVVEIDGTVYLMRYCVETSSNVVTMSYKVFGISILTNHFEGSEDSLDAGSITVYLVSDSAVDPAVSFPIEEMTVFADTVKGYMEHGRLAASTLGGVFEFGGSADRDNPVSPYLYDIFPWIPELAAKCGVNTEGIHSPKQLLAALQDALPADDSVAMPDVAADGSYFITGDYYSDSDRSCLRVRMREDGSYGGRFLIDNALNAEFTGHYDNGILTATQIDNYPDHPPYEMEIFFQNGKATVTITADDEEYFIKVGETLTLDRNQKPEEFSYLRNAEDYPVRE